MRGYAALSVVFYHCWLLAASELGPTVLREGLLQVPRHAVALKVALSLLNGEVAVSVFFLISGIVLFRSLAGLHRDGLPNAAGATAWRFLLRRAVRIWPVMAVCVVIQSVAFWAFDLCWPHVVPTYTFDELGTNLALLAFPVNGATWTLAVELAGAPVLLLAFFATRRWGWAAVAGFLALAAVPFKYGGVLFHSTGLIAGLPYLLLGAGIECDWLGPVRRSRAWPVLAGLAGPLLLADVLLVPFGFFKMRSVLMMLSLTVLVGSVQGMRAGVLLRMLQAPLSQHLGRISFSLYLWNVPIFTLLFGLVGYDLVREHVLASGLLLGTLTVLLTLPVAEVSERWLERPCIRLGRALTGRGGAPREPASAARPEAGKLVARGQPAARAGTGT
ncbi:MAG: acyltransferase [Acetobacteraceae bacterium]|nr:acyltransferase [Acetobacteraceae bacterium]